MTFPVRLIARLRIAASHPAIESTALLLTRLALAGVFWRSGRSKVAEGTWLQVSDATHYLFQTDYAAVPLPPAFAAEMALACETVFPILLLAGFATRVSSLALLGMTMTIQIFVFPDAWWPVHSLWAAMCLILIARGSGWIGIDRWIAGQYLK